MIHKYIFQSMRVGTKGSRSATIINIYIVGSLDDLHYKRISQTPCGVPLLSYTGVNSYTVPSFVAKYPSKTLDCFVYHIRYSSAFEAYALYINFNAIKLLIPLILFLFIRKSFVVKQTHSHVIPWVFLIYNSCSIITYLLSTMFSYLLSTSGIRIIRNKGTVLLLNYSNISYPEQCVGHSLRVFPTLVNVRELGRLMQPTRNIEQLRLYLRSQLYVHESKAYRLRRVDKITFQSDTICRSLVAHV